MENKAELTKRIGEILQKVHDDAINSYHLEELGYSDRATEQLLQLCQDYADRKSVV